MNCPDCCYQDWCAGTKVLGKLTLCEAHPLLFGQNEDADEETRSGFEEAAEETEFENTQGHNVPEEGDE